MRPFRPTAGVPATALLLVSFFLSSGCAPTGQATHGETTARMDGQRLAGTSPQGETTRENSEGRTLSATIPARDAPGEPVPGLPHHPGSVRLGYSEEKAGKLKFVRAMYQTGEGPEAVRGFYRGAFRAGGWQVANVEYLGGGWHFLVLRGDREAGVEILPRGGGSEVEIELSGPVRSPAGGAQESGASAGGSKR